MSFTRTHLGLYQEFLVLRVERKQSWKSRAKWIGIDRHLAGDDGPWYKCMKVQLIKKFRPGCTLHEIWICSSMYHYQFKLLNWKDWRKSMRYHRSFYILNNLIWSKKFLKTLFDGYVERLSFYIPSMDYRHSHIADALDQRFVVILETLVSPLYFGKEDLNRLLTNYQRNVTDSVSRCYVDCFGRRFVYKTR